MNLERTPPSIFAYEDYRPFLVAMQTKHPLRKKPLSVNQWSKQLGIKSPRNLGMVLSGDRLPSARLLELLGRDLKLDTKAKRYLELLVLKEKFAGDEQLLTPIAQDIKQLRGWSQGKVVMTSEIQKYVSRWYMLVIKQLITSKDFKEDFDWVERKLRGKITNSEFKQALHIFESLGLFVRGADGKLKPTETRPHFSSEDIPSASVRQHHRQMLDRSKEALMEQDVKNREFLSLVLPIKTTNIVEAKAMIREFRDQFHQKFDAPGESSIGQLNIQFFFHTQH